MIYTHHFSYGFSVDWNLESAAAVCQNLKCGSALFTVVKLDLNLSDVWVVRSDCVQRKNAAVRDCVFDGDSGLDHGLQVVCSESVQLLSGQSSCFGFLQIWDQYKDWSWVCEGALDRVGAEVLCRELGCGPPLLQGALSPLEQTFHCEGHESALMDCPQDQTRTNPETCSRLHLTCSEPLRLVGGASRCEGIVEVEFRREWRRLMIYTHHFHYGFVECNLESATAVCQDLKCDSAIFTDVRQGLKFSDVWVIRSDCVKRKNAAVRDCVFDGDSDLDHGLQVVCSDLLKIPEVSVYEGAWPVSNGAWSVSEGAWSPQGTVPVLMGAQFWVTCSVEPQYPGGSFQLFSPTVNLTLPAVNHSAHFLFTDVSPAHKGNYTCVYLLHMFNYNFSSSSSILIHPRESSKIMILVLISIGVVLINMVTVLIIYCKRRTGEEVHTGRKVGGASLGPESCVLKTKEQGLDPARTLRDNTRTSN